MKRMKLTAFLLMSLLAGSLTAQSPDWSSWIVLAPNPSPYFSDWENNPNSGSLFLEYRGSSQIRVVLRMTLVSNTKGQILAGQSQVIQFTGGSEIREISTPKIVDWNAVQKDPSTESQVRRTGRLPEGQYTVCVEARDLRFRTLTTACASFTIVYPDPPYLITPVDKGAVTTEFPNFQWSPVQVPASYPVTYRLRIVELLKFQNPQTAIASNYVHHKADLTTTSLIYPLSALSFNKGKTYVWQVQALDFWGTPIASNDGKSQIWTFNFAGPQAALKAPDFVNDGPSPTEDIDYTNSKTTLSAYWGDVIGTSQSGSKYRYAIGTTSGGTELVKWTDNGMATHFTRADLKLNHKQKYFASVKVKDAYGTEGPVATSNGAVADTSMPISMVEVQAPAGQTFGLYQNTANFTVKWKGLDDVSPVEYYSIQYRYENEITWTPWLSKTGLTSAIFTSAQMKGDGKYYFRSRAWDKAGNEGVFKDKVEDETTVDTVAPASEVAPQPPTRTETSFTVKWSGTDATSGIDYYDIQVQEDGGAWTTWLFKQSSTSHLFTGKMGHKYAFRCRAVDKAGNAEKWPQTYDTITSIGKTPWLPPTVTAKLSPTKLKFHPTKTKDAITASLLLTAPAGEEVTITGFDIIEGISTFQKSLGKLTLKPGIQQDVIIPIEYTVADQKAMLSVSYSSYLQSMVKLKKVYVFRGLDSHKQPVAAKSDTLNITIYKKTEYAKQDSVHDATFPPEEPYLKITASPKVLVYYPGKTSNTVSYTFSSGSKSKIDTTLDSFSYSISGGDIPSYVGVSSELKGNAKPNIALKAGQQTNWSATITIPESEIKSLLSSYKDPNTERVSCKLSVEFGPKFWKYQPGWVDFVDFPSVAIDILPTAPDKRLVATADPTQLNFYKGEKEKSVSFSLSSKLSPNLSGVDVQITKRTATLEFAGATYRTTTESMNKTVKSGQTVKFPAYAVTLTNPDSLLGNKTSVTGKLVMKFDGKEVGFNKPAGASVTVPITVSSKASPLAGTDSLVLIPGVAHFKPTIDSDYLKVGDKQIYNGQGELVIIPSPFDTTRIKCFLSALTFAPDPKNSKRMIVQSGSLSKKWDKKYPLFYVYKKIIHVHEISFDNARPNKLMINQAVAHVPVIDRAVYMTNLVIDKDGLNLKVSEQELHAFGLTFRVTDLELPDAKAGDLIAFTAHLRLKGKPKADEFVTTKLKIRDVNGIKKIAMKAIPADPGLRLIPKTDYVNFKSFEFIEKSDDDWVLSVSVESKNLPIFDKIGPLTSTFEYEKSGKIRGKIALVNETTPGYQNDKTAVKLGKWGAIDLTYLGVQIGAVEKISMNGAAPDTSWEMDPAASFVGMAMDLWLPVVGDPNNRIAVGTPAKPGLSIDFNGKVSTSAIGVAVGKKLDLKAIYIKLTSLTITPYPFELALSGGLGVNMGGVVEGEIALQGLKMDSDGNFTNFNEVIKGGNLSILKVVSLGIADLKYSDKPSQLAYMDNVGSTAKAATMSVDSYFRMQGANLNIGKSGQGGSGGFDDLLVFTAQGKNNFILSHGKLVIQSTVDLDIDFKYVNNPQLGKYVSVGGGAEIAKKYKAIIFGKIGSLPNGDATWGFFVSASGLQIPIGPVMLDELGGGFFYRPSDQDIKDVRKIAKFSRPDMGKTITQKRPKPTDAAGFAVFICGGIVVSDKNLMSGRALMAVTANNWSLDAEVKALKEKATGRLYLNINWDPAYFEGKIQIGIDFVVLDAEEANNYLAIYAYNKKAWGVMGKMEVTVFFITKVTAELYVGDQGFLFDFAVEYSIDIGLVSGGIKYEIMAWWRKDVSWGAYASAKAWGDVLWGLVGAEIGLEGALIGAPDFTIYCAGWLKVEVIWIEVFEGKVWIAVGENGFEGGTGSDSKYDKIIADARKTGKQMKDKMEKLAKELEKARLALYTLNEQQRAAAGKALIHFQTGSDFATAFIGVLIKKGYDEDRKAGGPDAHWALNQAYKLIWDDKAAKLEATRKKLEQDSVKIAAALKQLDSQEKQVKALLKKNRELIQGKLPSIQDLGKLGSPVGAAQYQTVVVNGQAKTVKVGYGFDTQKAKSSQKSMSKQQQDMAAYRQQLLKMVKGYAAKLKEIDGVLYGGSSSVSSLTVGYTTTFDQVSGYSIHFMDYLNDTQDWGAQKSSALFNLKDKIESDMQIHATNPHWWNKRIAYKRNVIVNTLKSAGGVTKAAKLDTSDNTINFGKVSMVLGREMWYEIPRAGFIATAQQTSVARQGFVKAFKKNNDLYQAKWNLFTIESDRVYDRKARLYTLMYDLLDRLSLEAGTRKLEGASPDVMIATTDWNALAIAAVSGAQWQGGSSGSGDMVATPPGTGPGGPQSAFDAGAAVGPAGQTGPQLQSPGKATGQFKPNWAQSWDFEKERKYVKKLLQVPKITAFSGKVRSDLTTSGYARLSLNWNATHPVGIVEYSFAIPNYSDPVALGQVSPPSSGGSQPPVAILDPGGTTGAPAFGMQFDLGPSDQAGPPTVDTGQWIGQIGATATVGSFTSGFAPPTLAWRAVASKKKMVVPFLNGAHKAAPYQVWIRARGAGGYALERRGNINVDYSLAATGTSSDFGKPTKESTLDTADKTPPTAPSVDDKVDTTSSATLIYAEWSASDAESGIQEYQYQVGYQQGWTYVASTPWISAGGQTQMNIRLAQAMKPGLVYYVKVKAKNGAGLWSTEGISNGIRLKDPTPPSTPVLGSVSLGQTLVATWAASSDAESKVLGYKFALGTTSGASNVIDWTSLSGATLLLDSASLSQLATTTIQKGQTYYFSVKAVNGIAVEGAAATKAVVAQ